MLVSDVFSRVYINNSNPEFDENSRIHHLQFVI